MFLRRLTFIALLAASMDPGSWASVTFQSTCRVKGQPEDELVLHCGDGEHGGAVQFWHTPFGDLHGSAPRSDLDPVFLRRDGNLVIPRSGLHHSGLYYCVLRQPQGSTLWPYQLQVGPGGRGVCAEGELGAPGCSARRFRRDAGSPGQRETRVPGEVLAGAVAATVLLTFLVGFSAGAALRAQVLRCLQAVGLRHQRRQPDVPDVSPVAMTTLPLPHDDLGLRTGATHHGSPGRRSIETPGPITTPSPPAKPKRSFRDKEEELEGTTYLEGCDYNWGEEETTGGGDGEEEATEPSSCYRDDDRSQSETEDDKSSENGDAAEEHRSREEATDEEVGEQSEGPEQESTETDGEKGEEEAAEEELPRSSRRRSRIIRLYQYDEDGRRYGHLPDPDAPEPAPRLQQRSRSLSRLNAIMTAASAGPMEPAEEAQPFHMEI